MDEFGALWFWAGFWAVLGGSFSWGLLAAVVVAAAALAIGFVRRAPKPEPLVRFDIVPPPEIATLDVPRISPDGRLIAFDSSLRP